MREHPFWCGRRVPDWMEWLTNDRLSRLNHLRRRAGVPELTREEAARLICGMSRESVEELKERIVE